MKKIAVLTSGGDCSGMNPALRAVVRCALGRGMEVVGVRRGYTGLIEGALSPLAVKLPLEGAVGRGGTFLHSARCAAMRTPEGQRQALETLRRHEVEALVVIGGDGSLRGAQVLQGLGVAVAGIPASIDNDIALTDMSLGVDSALARIVSAVDCLKDTSSSHERCSVVEVMGRSCGYLALAAAIATGAEYALVPEAPFDLEAIAVALRRRYEEGRDNAILLVAEGAAGADAVVQALQDRVGFEVRRTVLGHVQRGGSPSPFDRILGARFAEAAVAGLVEGASGFMTALEGGRIVRRSLAEVAAAGQRPLDPQLLALAQALAI